MSASTGAASTHTLAVADIERVASSFRGLSEALAGKSLSTDGAKVLIRGVRRFTASEIEAAIDQHMDRSTWMPKPADIVRLIEGEMPDTPALLETGHANRYPLAIVVRQILGTDLASAHPKALEARIESRIDDVLDFLRRATRGDFTDEELRRMRSAGIDACGPIGPGMPPPRVPFRAALAARVRQLREDLLLPDRVASTDPEAGAHRTPAALAARDAAFAEWQGEGIIDAAVLKARTAASAVDANERHRRTQALREGGMLDGASPQAIAHAQRVMAEAQAKVASTPPDPRRQASLARANAEAESAR